MDQSTIVSASAIAVPLLSFIALIIDLPPLVWHIRNHNLAASCLVFWVMVDNFMNLTNALIWPTDDIATWWNGKIFCDIQVKLRAAVGIGCVSTLVSIMRSLAKILDTENTVLSPSKGYKRKEVVIDLLLCVGLPISMMPMQYIVQPTRYWIMTVMGCIAPADRSWPSIVLVAMWPLLASIGAVYNSGT